MSAVLDLLGAAAEWTAARGQPNWPARFSTRLIARAVDAGELFVAETDALMVATLQLQWSDPHFWGATDADADAGYVHRLAVRRGARRPWKTSLYERASNRKPS